MNISLCLLVLFITKGFKEHLSFDVFKLPNQFQETYNFLQVQHFKVSLNNYREEIIYSTGWERQTKFNYCH